MDSLMRGKAHWAKHTALLLENGTTATNVTAMCQGHIIQADCTHNDRNIKIINLYVPAVVADRMAFFQKFLTLPLSDLHVVMKDLNTFPDVALDRCPSRQGCPKDWEILFQKKSQLVDIIRQHHLCQ